MEENKYKIVIGAMQVPNEEQQQQQEYETTTFEVAYIYKGDYGFIEDGFDFNMHIADGNDPWEVTFANSEIDTDKKKAQVFRKVMNDDDENREVVVFEITGVRTVPKYTYNTL